MLIEACCDSLATARAAALAGATRVEVCGPGDGGTTPSLGLVSCCRDTVPVPLAVMIRPRAGDFVYTDDEADVMLADIVMARSMGVERIVIGALTREDRVDVARLRPLVEAASGMRLTMHRAFDRTPDLDEALDAILALGFDTVLTSGGMRAASQGAERLARLQRRAGESFTVMAGGGVRGDNVVSLVAASGVHAVHARATETAIIEGVVAALRGTAPLGSLIHR